MKRLVTGQGCFGHFALAAALLAAVAVSGARAQDSGTLVADGLNGPMGVLVGPDGIVWVIDSGTGGDEETMGFNPVTQQRATVRIGDTSRILKISPDGSQTLMATLPSRMYDPTSVYGGGRLARVDGELYATNSAWSENLPPERPPLTAAIVRIKGDDRTEIANTWDIERDENPAGLARESNPYGLTAGPDGKLWVTDAAANTLLKVDPASGELEVAAVFDGLASPIPGIGRGGARVTDPVPTAVAFDDQANAYVSFLPGFPMLPDSAKVVKVTPEGEILDFADHLTTVVDLRRGPDGELYAVSFGTFTQQGPVPSSGAIVRVREGSGSEEVLTGLSFPTSVDFNAAGDAFVTTNGAGPAGAGELWRFDRVAPPTTAAASSQSDPRDAHAPFLYTLVYADSTGTSHFEDASFSGSRIDLGHGATALTSGPISGDDLRFFCFEPGTVVEWHSAPRRQLYVILEGHVDLQVSDGEVRRFLAGDAIVGTATQGKGVRAVWSDSVRSCVGVMPLKED